MEMGKTYHAASTESDSDDEKSALRRPSFHQVSARAGCLQNRKELLLGCVVFVIAVLLLVQNQKLTNLRREDLDMIQENGFIDVLWTGRFFDRYSNQEHASSENLLRFNLKDETFNRLFLISAVSSSTNPGNVDQEQMSMRELPRSSSEANVFKFVLRHDNSVDLVSVNTQFIGENEVFSEELLNEIQEPVLHYFPVDSNLDYGSSVFSIDVSPLLLKLFYIIQSKQPIEITRLRLLKVKAFQQNVMIRVEVVYNEKAPDFVSFADSEITEEIEFNMFLLDKKPMMPRIISATDSTKVGFFVRQQQVIGNPDHPRNMVPRYNIVKDKIMYFVDDSVPSFLHNTIQTAVLKWNDAFDNDPIDCKIPGESGYPSDFDAADGRFNAIAWGLSLNSTFALGSQVVDPRSGEVLRSVIVIAQEWLDAFYSETRQWLLLSNFKRRRDSDPDTQFLDRFTKDAVMTTVMHEVGHTLGLRHNFKGSLSFPAAKRCSGLYINENGFSSTVMDYLPPNILSTHLSDALKCESQPEPPYFQLELGKYDLAAMKYAYGSQSDMLESMNMLSELKFATDEQQYTTSKDAENLVYDFTDDPLGYFEDELRKICEMRVNFYKDGFPYKLEKDEEQATFMLEYSLLSQASRQITNIGNYLGGYRYTSSEAMPYDTEVQTRAFQLLQSIFVLDDLYPKKGEYSARISGDCSVLASQTICLGKQVVDLTRISQELRLAAVKIILQPTKFEDMHNSDLVTTVFDGLADTLFGNFSLSSPSLRNTDLWESQIMFLQLIRTLGFSFYEISMQPRLPNFVSQETSALLFYHSTVVFEKIDEVYRRIMGNSTAPDCCSEAFIGHVLVLKQIAGS